MLAVGEHAILSISRNANWSLSKENISGYRVEKGNRIVVLGKRDIGFQVKDTNSRERLIDALRMLSLPKSERAAKDSSSSLPKDEASLLTETTLTAAEQDAEDLLLLEEDWEG